MFFLKIQTTENPDLCMMALDWASDMTPFDAVCKTPLFTRCLYKAGPWSEVWHQRMWVVLHLLHNKHSRYIRVDISSAVLKVNNPVVIEVKLYR